MNPELFVNALEWITSKSQVRAAANILNVRYPQADTTHSSPAVYQYITAMCYNYSEQNSWSANPVQIGGVFYGFTAGYIKICLPVLRQSRSCCQNIQCIYIQTDSPGYRKVPQQPDRSSRSQMGKKLRMVIRKNWNQVCSWKWKVSYLDKGHPLVRCR